MASASDAGEGVPSPQQLDDVGHEGSPAQAVFVAFVMVVMLGALVRGWKTPEVVVSCDIAS